MWFYFCGKLPALRCSLVQPSGVHLACPSTWSGKWNNVLLFSRPFCQSLFASTFLRHMFVIRLVDKEATVLFGGIRMSFNLCLLARTMSMCVFLFFLLFFFPVGMAPIVENTQRRHYRAMKPSRTFQTSAKENTPTGKNLAFNPFWVMWGFFRSPSLS